MMRRDFLWRWSVLSGSVLAPAMIGAGRAYAAGPDSRLARIQSTDYAVIPVGYVRTGRAESIPPLILYGVALQESARLFGKHVLPYPWTLNVAGTPRRFTSHAAAAAALRASVAQGITSVDCGLMQVNWRYHNDKLGNYYQALDPYPNLRTGALILRQEYAKTGDWFKAVGRYHAPDNPLRANAYANSVYQRMARVIHA